MTNTSASTPNEVRRLKGRFPLQVEAPECGYSARSARLTRCVHFPKWDGRKGVFQSFVDASKLVIQLGMRGLTRTRPLCSAVRLEGVPLPDEARRSSFCVTEADVFHFSATTSEPSAATTMRLIRAPLSLGQQGVSLPLCPFSPRRRQRCGPFADALFAGG